MSDFLKNMKIDIKSFIIGMIIFTACLTIGFSYSDYATILSAASAIGLLYLGYHCKDMKEGIILGVIATIPFAIINAVYNLMGCNNTTEYIFAIIAILTIGAVVGALGAFLKNSRAKAKAEAQNIGKNKKKNNKKNKKKNKKN